MAQKVYEIAQYIPLAFRWRMVTAKYSVSHSSTNNLKRLRTEEGYCPMGLLSPERLGRAPTGGLIAGWIRENGIWKGQRPTWDFLRGVAWEFVDAWDDGEIEDLHVALDVPKK